MRLIYSLGENPPDRSLQEAVNRIFAKQVNALSNALVRYSSKSFSRTLTSPTLVKVNVKWVPVLESLYIAMERQTHMVEIGVHAKILGPTLSRF